MIVGLALSAMIFAFAGAPSPSPLPSPTTQILSKADAKVMLKTFVSRQGDGMKALEHQQKFELKEMKSSQAMRLKEWEAKERSARHIFFQEHAAAPERKAYVKDFLGRRSALLAMFKDEQAQLGKSQEIRRKSLKDEQAEKLKEFREYIGLGQRPPDWLWK